MVRIPFSSTVLQRRRGYRRVLQHFSRIRLAPMIPLDKEAMRDLLELKNIALLYELWTFFRIVHELSVLEGPPVRSGRPTSGLLQTDFAAGGTFEWASGVAWCTASTSPGRARDEDIPTRCRCVPISRFRSPTGETPASTSSTRSSVFMGSPMLGLAGSDKDGDDEKAEERVGTFKRGDIYKMHAYRDAIPDARSVWILYPGGESRLFGIPGSGGQSGHQAVSSHEGLPEKLQGVGAIPVGPILGDETDGGSLAATGDSCLRETLLRILGVDASEDAGGANDREAYVTTPVPEADGRGRSRKARGVRRPRCQLHHTPGNTRNTWSEADMVGAPGSPCNLSRTTPPRKATLLQSLPPVRCASRLTIAGAWSTLHGE